MTQTESGTRAAAFSRRKRRAFTTTIVIPAGRRRFLEILVPQILAQEGWDELQLWRNTTEPSDLDYIDGLTQLDSRITVVQPPTMPPAGSATIGQFFEACTEPQTVYIRFDDDIVFIEPGLIESLAEFRWENPDYFLVSPAVINNALWTFILQARLQLQMPAYAAPSCLDEVGWAGPLVAEGLHSAFLDALDQKNIDNFKSSNTVVSTTRFSINCIAWLGSEFSRFEGRVPAGDVPGE